MLIKEKARRRKRISKKRGWVVKFTPFLIEMESIKEIIDLLRGLDIEQMFNSIMDELSNEIIELNQIEQLAEGIDANGERIISISAEEQRTGKPYAFRTINERRAAGLQVDNVDLKVRGIFWKTFKVVKVNNGWEVQANFNIHGEDIRANFDSSYDFTGLTRGNLEVLVYGSIVPKLENKIKEYLRI